MEVFFSVGEPSGDLHGANLIRDLSELIPNTKFSGFGGPKMQAAGLDPLVDLTQYPVMYLPDAIRLAPKFWGFYQQARRYFKTNKVEAVVLIDYPGFNWWIAKAARAEGIPVFYYGVPQMWAWASWRIRKIQKYVDHVLCKLPFEKDWFEQRGCRATFIGHPYFDEVSRQSIDDPFLAHQNDQPGELVTLLPGSRTKEIEANLDVMYSTARILAQRVPRLRFAVACFNEKHKAFAEDLATKRSANVEIHAGRTPELIRAAKCCLACSGSVSLELMSQLKPTVIHYKINRILKLSHRFIIKTRYITLVNLLATKRIERDQPGIFDPDAPGAEQVPFPEYLTVDDKSVAMANHLERWLTDPHEYRRRVEQLRELNDQWGQPGASTRAAIYILKALKQHDNARMESSSAA